jgi:hypothetical protein
MASISVDVEVDIDEFDTLSLINELQYRIKNGGNYGKGFRDTEKKALIKMIKDLKYGDLILKNWTEGPTLLDEMKNEVLIEARDKYTLDQLKALLQI